jgi:hypothetical protein
MLLTYLVEFCASWCLICILMITSSAPGSRWRDGVAERTSSRPSGVRHVVESQASPISPVSTRYSSLVISGLRPETGCLLGQQFCTPSLWLALICNPAVSTMAVESLGLSYYKFLVINCAVT